MSAPWDSYISYLAHYTINFMHKLTFETIFDCAIKIVLLPFCHYSNFQIVQSRVQIERFDKYAAQPQDFEFKF